MPQASKTFRIFVSSTFSDLKEERNALQQHVFPKLRELCMQHGCRFQAIDLRWGVSEEASRDQQTVKICLEEIKRCQRVTPRPNFIVLLGDRYGWRPLPAEIPASEFDLILPGVTNPDDDALLARWYRRDDNATPAVYCLQSRTGGFADYAGWQPVERRLHSILLNAAAGISLPPGERVKYTASATEQEIVRGALSVPDANEHVFCFFRRITNRNDLINDLSLSDTAANFIDVDESPRPDQEAFTLLGELTQRLRDLLPDNKHEYEARWVGSGVTTDHIGSLPEKLEDCLRLIEDGNAPKSLCVDVWRRLGRVILDEVKKIENVDPLDKEIEGHKKFGEERAKFFTGRARYLDAISDYAGRDEPHPLALWGESGSGKSAVMANAIAECGARNAECVIVSRFIGATPASADGRALLESLCRQVSRSYGAAEADIPAEYRELMAEFPKRLALATAERPLILFLDALDQLSIADNARNLTWSPSELPAHVRLIVSTSPGECLTQLEGRLPAANLVQLGPMPVEEGSTLLDQWLAEAGRMLRDDQRAEVLAKFAVSGLPLYLKLAFEEERRWRSYAPRSETSLFTRPVCAEDNDTKGVQDGTTKVEGDVKAIIHQMFTRLSSNSNHGPTLVSHAIGYLAAAKEGLTEDELVDLLSNDDHVIVKITEGLQFKLTDNEGVFQDFLKHSHHELTEKRLPVVVWSRLLSDLDPYLTVRNVGGVLLLSFYHGLFAEVATTRFLRTEVKKRRHFVLAHYFLSQPLFYASNDILTPNLHVFSELPYQLSLAEMWPELTELLVNMDFFATSCDLGHEYLLMYYWNQVRALAAKDPLYVSIDIPDLYRQAWSGIDDQIRYSALGRLGSLFQKLGLSDAAERCLKEEAAYLQRSEQDSQDLISNLNDHGLVLLDRGDAREALELLSNALDHLNRSPLKTHEIQRGLATVLMNMARAYRDLGRGAEGRALLHQARDYMEEATGTRSPEVATVVQSLGNLAMAERDYLSAFKLQTEAFEIRRSALGADHLDVALSLHNLANAEAMLSRFNDAIIHSERAMEIFDRGVGRDHNFTKSSKAFLDQCLGLARKAESQLSGYGVLLLVSNSQPQAENPPNARESVGAERIGRSIAELLIIIWNDMVAHGSALPLLIVCCPGFEQSVQFAMAQPIAKRIPASLLRWISIPTLTAPREDPASLETLVQLTMVRNQILQWVRDYQFNVIMVSPLSNTGATLDWRLLDFVANDDRPLALEAVDFDGREGPIIGLYQGDGDPRPALMPADEWKGKYAPTNRDQRATGTLYLNVPAIRTLLTKSSQSALSPLKRVFRLLSGWVHLTKSSQAALNPLDQWSLGPLSSIASAPYEHQLRVFEKSLSDLVMLLKSRPIKCPPERGRRGFPASSSEMDR